MDVYDVTNFISKYRESYYCLHNHATSTLIHWYYVLNIHPLDMSKVEYWPIILPVKITMFCLPPWSILIPNYLLIIPFSEHTPGINMWCFLWFVHLLGSKYMFLLSYHLYLMVIPLLIQDIITPSSQYHSCHPWCWTFSILCTVISFYEGPWCIGVGKNHHMMEGRE